MRINISEFCASFPYSGKITAKSLKGDPRQNLKTSRREGSFFLTTRKTRRFFFIKESILRLREIFDFFNIY